MEPMSQAEREVRAARNQALFRELNESLKKLAAVDGTFSIACECADTTCVERVEIGPREYQEIRNDARHFAVLPGHVYPEVERVVSEPDGYLVVEKLGSAAEVAEILAQDTG